MLCCVSLRLAIRAGPTSSDGVIGRAAGYNGKSRAYGSIG